MTVAVNAHTHTQRKVATLAGPQRYQDYQLLAQKSFNPLRETQKPQHDPKTDPFHSWPAEIYVRHKNFDSGAR